MSRAGTGAHVAAARTANVQFKPGSTPMPKVAPPPIRFPTAQAFAAGRSTFGIASGDFNGDGKKDIAVTNASDGTVSVFIGAGDGTFTTPAPTYTVGTGPEGIVAADFNGDGKLDLAVTNNGSAAVSVLLGNGDGTFGAATNFAVGNGPASIVVADVNGDGKRDLIVGNTGNGTVSVLLGNGDGTFQAQQTFAVGNSPGKVAVGDFNGDGKPDIVVANYGDNTVSVLLGNGDGTFQMQQAFNTGFGPTAVAVGDFDKDGKLDLAVTNFGGLGMMGPIVGNSVSILLGNGDGTFANATNFPVGSEPVDIIVGDFNKDGNLDLAVTDFAENIGLGIGFGNAVSILFGTGTGSFRAPVSYAAGNGPIGLVADDFNGDGNTDLAVSDIGLFTGLGFGGIAVLLNTGSGAFQAPRSFAAGGFSANVAVADFNGDGILDVAVSNFVGVIGPIVAPSDTVSIFIGKGDGTFKRPVNYTVGNISSLMGFTPLLGIATGDFNGDGFPDLVVSTLGQSIGVLLNNGDGTFNDAIVTTLPGPAGLIVTGDFNKDGKTDVAFVGGNNVILLTGKGDGTFNAPTMNSVFPVGKGTTNLVAGDFNKDGYLDVAATNAGDGTVSVLLNNKSAAGGFVTPATTYAVGTSPISIQTADFNNDGNLDLVVTNAGSGIPAGMGGSVSILTGKGDGTFNAQVPYTLNGGTSAPYTVAVADFNRDGSQDLVVADIVNGTANVLLNNGDGTFATPASAFVVGGYPTGIGAGDFNGDGKPDFVVSSLLGGDLNVFLNISPVDLGITAMGNPMTIYPGKNVTYTLTATDTLAGSDNGTKVTFALDPNLTFQSATAPMGVVVSAPAVGTSGTVTFTFPNGVPGNGSATLTVVAQAVAQPTAMTATSTATITGGATDSDSNPMNNTTTVTTGLLPLITFTAPTTMALTANTSAPFSQVFTATGGTNTGFTYTESGTLPSGITFTGNTLSGMTTQSGSFPFTVTATDSGGNSATKQFTLTVNVVLMLTAPTGMNSGNSGTATMPVVKPGSNVQLNLMGLPTSGVTFMSSNPSSVMVSANGTIIPITPGTATITATAPGGQTATITVTVNPAMGAGLTNPNAQPSTHTGTASTGDTPAPQPARAPSGGNGAQPQAASATPAMPLPQPTRH